MKIAIDARMITESKMHGIARYTLELIKSLNKLDTPDDIHFLIFTQPSPDNYLNIFDNLDSRFKLIPIDLPWISIKELFYLSSYLKKYQIDLFHSPSFVVPLFAPCPLILTLHDLNHVDLKENYSLSHKLYYNFLVKPIASKADKIITVSEFSRKKLQHWLKGDSSKNIEVIYNGLSDFYQIEKTDTTKKGLVSKTYNLPEKYILGISHEKAHKNSKNSVLGYLKSKTELPLVLLGKLEFLPFSAQDAIQSSGKKVSFIPFVSEEHLPLVYNLAELFLFPSLYEGFGLPPLEALGMETPSIVSKGICFEEILGSCAIYALADSVEDISNKIDSFFVNPLIWGELKQKRLEVLSSYNLNKIAKKTLTIYLEVLNTKNKNR